MNLNIKLILSLLVTLPSTFALTNGKCSGRSGICISTDNCNKFSGTSFSGQCPDDPADIKCCDDIPCQSDGKNGQCIFVSECSGTTVSGLCPGGTDFKCCIPSSQTSSSQTSSSQTSSSSDINLNNVKQLATSLLKFEDGTDAEMINLLEQEIDNKINCIQATDNIKKAFDKASNYRKAIIISMAYQMGCGTDGLGGFVKTLNYMAEEKWDEASVEMINSKWYNQTPERATRHSYVIKNNDCGDFCEEYGWTDNSINNNDSINTGNTINTGDGVNNEDSINNDNSINTGDSDSPAESFIMNNSTKKFILLFFISLFTIM